MGFILNPARFADTLTSVNIGDSSGDWNGDTSSFTFGSGSGNDITTGTANKSIYSAVTPSGDFDFVATLDVSYGGMGVFANSEVGTYNSSDGDGYGGLDSMTASFWLDRSSNAKVGGSTDTGGGSLGIGDGSVVKFARRGSTIKLYDDGVVVHTFATTFSGAVKLHLGTANSNWDAGDVTYAE